MWRIEPLETELRALEEEEAQEHRKIREKFYERQKKLLAKRDAEIEQIPNFWVETLQVYKLEIKIYGIRSSEIRLRDSQ